MREPTSEECESSAPYEHGGRRGFATWYPQMGGYVGKCVVLDAGSVDQDGSPGSCFDVYVWHDGEFPFGDRAPVGLHHCDPAQFIRFGEQVRARLVGGACLECGKIGPECHPLCSSECAEAAASKPVGAPAITEADARQIEARIAEVLRKQGADPDLTVSVRLEGDKLHAEISTTDEDLAERIQGMASRGSQARKPAIFERKPCDGAIEVPATPMEPGGAWVVPPLAGPRTWTIPLGDMLAEARREGAREEREACACIVESARDVYEAPEIAARIRARTAAEGPPASKGERIEVTIGERGCYLKATPPLRVSAGSVGPSPLALVAAAERAYLLSAGWAYHAAGLPGWPGGGWEDVVDPGHNNIPGAPARWDHESAVREQQRRDAARGDR